MTKGNVEKILYFLTIFISILFIYFGNKVATLNNEYSLLSGSGEEITIAKVDAIRRQGLNEESGDMEVFFSAKAKEKEIIGVQRVNVNDPTVNMKIVEEGDKVILDSSIDSQWQFVNYVRTDYILFIGILFIILLIVFGGKKGFNTLVSLLFTVLAVFLVFVPAVISGENIYLWSILICIFTIFMTIFIINGFNTKSFMAIVGCVGGVFISGCLTILYNHLLKWNGIIDADTQRLIMEFPNMDLLGIIFASITIGAMGAVMDIAMSMASSLFEIKSKVLDISQRELFKSGMEIGKDMMGTMANTLILAYIGSALTVTILQIIYNGSLFELLNKENIILEMMQAIIGSIGILLAIPFTAFMCSIFYKKKII